MTKITINEAYKMISEFNGEEALSLVMATPSSRVRNTKQAHKAALEICNKIKDTDTFTRENIYVALMVQSGLDPMAPYGN